MDRRTRILDNVNCMIQICKLSVNNQRRGGAIGTRRRIGGAIGTRAAARGGTRPAWQARSRGLQSSCGIERVAYLAVAAV